MSAVVFQADKERSAYLQARRVLEKIEAEHHEPDVWHITEIRANKGTQHGTKHRCEACGKEIELDVSMLRISGMNLLGAQGQTYRWSKTLHDYKCAAELVRGRLREFEADRKASQRRRW